MVDLGLLDETHEGVVGDEGVDVEIEYLQQIGDDHCLGEHVEGVDGCAFVFEVVLQFACDLHVAVVLVKLAVEVQVVFELIDQRLQPVGQTIDALLVFEELPDVGLDDLGEVLIGLQHGQQLVEVEVDGLELLAGKDHEDSVVDQLVGEDPAGEDPLIELHLEVVLVLEVVAVAGQVDHPPNCHAVLDGLLDEEGLELVKVESALLRKVVLADDLQQSLLFPEDRALPLFGGQFHQFREREVTLFVLVAVEPPLYNLIESLR